MIAARCSTSCASASSSRVSRPAKAFVPRALGRSAFKSVVAQAAKPSDSIAPLALLANLAIAGQSLAEEAAAAAPPADLPMFALSPSEIILVSTPVVGYALFNIARQGNPKLQLSDGLLFIAAAFIVGNIFSIVFFKTSYY